MTERLYYDSATTTRFDATIVETLTVDGRPAVVLRETYFYPASGGQPCDSGTLGDSRVIDVLVREADDAVVHVLDAPPAAGPLPAAIDWPRRFDHMQQHTGQHILSRAFVNTAGADTVSFHLGQDACTIDLNVAALADGAAAAAEALANAIVWENRPITARFVNRADLDRLSLRKLPDVNGDALRIVEIADFDWNACGGTHVSHTGAVGLIKINRLERQKGLVRVEFRCGARAVADYDARQTVVTALTNRLTCGYWEVDAAVGRLQAELKETARQLKKAQGALLQSEAAQLLAAAEPAGAVHLVVQAFDGRDAADIKALGGHLTRNGPVIALLGVAGSAAEFVFTCSRQAPGDMQALLRPILDTVGGRGGGSRQFAQGGGVALKKGALEQLLAGAAGTVRRQLASG